MIPEVFVHGKGMSVLGFVVSLLFVICYQFLFNVNNIRKHDFLTVAL